VDEQTEDVPTFRSGRGRRWFLASGRTVLVMASVFVLGGAGYGWAAVRHVDHAIARTDVISAAAAGPTQDGGPLTEPLATPLNILVVGMDSRTDPQGNPLPASELAMLNAGPDDGEIDTDTMMLIHIPAGGQQAVAFSFPRDSYVQIAGGYGTHKLNSAFAYAHNAEASTLRAQGQTDPAAIERQADDAGRKNLIATIQNLLAEQVTINRYAEVNLAGFYNLANAVGGVQVCLKQAAHDDMTGASFPAGVQTLTGVQALNFVRQRHGLPGGDLDRIVRQQVFIGAIADKILSAGTLTDPAALNRLISAVRASVTLSTGWDVTTFAAQMQGLTGGNVRFTTIPTDGSATNSDGDVLLVNPKTVQTNVDSLIASSDQPSTTPTTSPTTSSVPPTTPPSAPPSDPASNPAKPGTITASGLPCID
jgi:LCP family protein required for cell wall assembly